MQLFIFHKFRDFHIDLGVHSYLNQPLHIPVHLTIPFV